VAFRKRHAGVLSTILILVLSGAALLRPVAVGLRSTAQRQALHIQVVGVGQNSDVLNTRTSPHVTQ